MANPKAPHEMLAKYMEDAGLTQTALAEKIGREPNVVSRIVRGERRPDIDTATAIEIATKRAVPATAWARPTKLPGKSAA